MILFILIASFLIRLISLDQSLWLDEAISANVAKNFNLIETIFKFSVNDFHPPLYYLFLNLWTKIFGYSEISLRMPSIIFSITTIYLIYLIGKLIKNKKTGLWAAVILGVNPLLIYFSQEARMYLITTMFLTVVLYNFLKIVKAKKIKIINILGINIFSFLSFASFYGSIFLITSMAIYFLFKKKFKLFFVTNIGIVLIILILAPLLLTQINHSKIMLAEVVNWNLVLGKATLKNLLLIPIKFSIGRISFNPKIFYYLVAGVWTLIVFAQVWWSGRKNKIFLYLLIMPLILGLIFSFFSPLMQYFRFLYLVPIMCLLLALIKSNFLKKISIVGFLIFSVVYLLNPEMHREDWKGLSQEIEVGEVYMIESVSDPIKYYRPDIKIKDIKTEKPTEKEITVIPYGQAIHGINIDQELRELGYGLVSEKSFRENKLSFYSLL